MSPCRPLALLAALVCLSGLVAQEVKKKEGPQPSSVDVRFSDGSLVRMAVLQEKLEVETKYGKLTVPTSEIRRIEFAFRLPEETGRKIEAAVRDLGHDQHARREAASKELVGLGMSAVPALQAAVRSKDPEVARQATAALTDIREKVPTDKLRFPTNDVIQTSEFTISGRIVTEAIRARTNYFGDVQLRISDLRHMHWMGGGVEAVVTIDAARHGGPAAVWMETDVMVEGQLGLLITASGQVDLQPQAPGQIVTGPGGSKALGRIGGFGAPAGRAGGPGLGARPPTTSYYAGALLGRVGETGRVFVIGERCEVTPGDEGKLHILIAPSPDGNACSGAYTVKIITRP